jgi:CubicO group peptidase (beta-lactamase class C family)
LQCASYLLARNGRIFATNAMGRLAGFDPDRGSMRIDSIRRVASITKIFTAVSIMQLVEQGKLYLGQPVKSLIPEFDTPMHGGITVFHLITHTSGLYTDAGFFQEPYLKDWWTGYNGTDWIKAMLSGPIHGKPGEQWIYCNAGFNLLGEIVQRVSGMSFEQYVQMNIIEPLRMERTFFQVPEHLHGEVCLLSEHDENRLKRGKSPDDPLPPSVGSIYSTLHDLWKLGQMLLNKGQLNGVRILGAKTVEAMTRNQLKNVASHAWGFPTPSYYYGLGVKVSSGSELMSPGTFSHEGAGRCALYIDPVESFIAVYIVPTQEAWLPESVVNTRFIIWSGIE